MGRIERLEMRNLGSTGRGKKGMASKRYTVVTSPRGVEGVFVPHSGELRHFWKVHGDLDCRETELNAESGTEALNTMRDRAGRMGHLRYIAQ